MVAVKLIPHLLSWLGIVLVLMRGFPGRRSVVTASGISGFVIGVAGAFFLSRSFPGTVLFGAITSALGVSFLFLWGISVAAIYRSTGRVVAIVWVERLAESSLYAGSAAALAGMVAGGVSACRLPEIDGTVLAFVLLVLASGSLAYVLAFAALAAEKRLPAAITASPSGLTSAVVSLLLLLTEVWGVNHTEDSHSLRVFVRKVRQ